MTMERRHPKETDQNEIDKAFNLLKDCMLSHPEIEQTLWAGAFWSVLVDGYSSSGISYEEFCSSWDEVKHHYKSWFYE